tara:strand:+ start:240 stop:437 length:198 start_codon:yes stop_codon:yes gene_type:complete
MAAAVAVAGLVLLLVLEALVALPAAQIPPILQEVLVVQAQLLQEALVGRQVVRRQVQGQAGLAAV